MKKTILVIAFALLTTATTFAQQTRQPTHGGTWWKDKSDLFHEAYVGGYKAGTHHAAGKDTPLSAFGPKELVAGLNTFYKDFRNRSIDFSDAITYVGDQLRGVPDDKLAAELLKLRAAAAATPVDE